jgi:4-hydroxybenzoate polyprenyltransferase
MARANHILKMTRPGNALMAAASVWLGGWVAGAKIDGPSLWLDGIAMGILAAAGNLHNDVIDLPVDRINRPDRPLPQGLVTLAQTRLFAGLLTLAALGIGFFRGTPQLLLFVCVTLLLFTYNRTLKGLPLVGNFVVALLCASALWLPSLDPALWPAGSSPLFLLPLILFSFLFTMIRELVKDMEDVEGDRAAHLRTFPIVAGVRASRLLALLLLCLALVSPVFPVILGIYPWTFLAGTLFLVVPPTLGAMLALFPSRNDWHQSQKMLKFAMIGGLFASALALKLSPFI